jgi:predicted nucleotidyltransferase component of viral defense system
MKQEVFSLIEGTTTTHDKLNLLREYLQAFILRTLHECEAFNCLSFVGGTALRFLYSLPRFSEDLDFSLESGENYNPEEWFKKLKREFEFNQFDASIKLNTQKTVHNAWISIPGLLKELELSHRSEQKISIKVEIDTKPPQGAISETTVINRHFLLALTSYNLASLMAGKVHALCTRGYCKGRDFYDLVWYLTQRPPVSPNIQFLEKALEQTLSQPFPAEDWKAHVLERLSSIDWKALQSDVEPFLERPDEIQFLTREYIKTILA